MIKIFYMSVIILAVLFTYSHAEETSEKRSADKKTILDFRETLNLSADQVEEIKKIQAEFKTRQSEALREIQRHEARLKELLHQEGDIREIIREVKEIFKLRGELFIEEILTARKIEGVLTTEQKKKWKEIRTKEIKK